MSDSLKVIVDSLLLLRALPEESFFSKYGFSLITFIITSVVSVFTVWFVTHKSYKNEYYKKIIDKRMEAYELLNPILSQLITYVKHGDNQYHGFFQDFKHLQSFRSQVVKVAANGNWFSQELFDELYELNEFLFKLERMLLNNQSNIIVEGVKHFNKLLDIQRNLEKYIIKDYKNLYLVKEYLQSSFMSHKKIS